MSIHTSTKPFDHRNGGDYPGNRGVILTAATGFTGTYSFSSEFPTLYITDNGEVDMSDGNRYTATDMLAWLDAAAVAIRNHG